MSSFDLSHDDLPPIDERLVVPGTRHEMWNGELVYVPPADPPHAERHAKVSALVEAHTTSEFKVAADMLTRTSKANDIAPDVSVFPAAPDPRTGGRQLEHLAFEIVSTVSLAKTGERAADLIQRGVRRVFAIDVNRSRALEWSRELGCWRMLDSNTQIEDLVLGAPLPISELVSAARADDAIARALIARHNPVIEELRAQERASGKQEGFAEGKQEGFAEGKQEGKQEGFAEGKQEGFAEGKQEGFAEGKQEGFAEGGLDSLRAAVLDVLRARSIELDPAGRARIARAQHAAQLRRWLVRAATAASMIELFAEP